MFWKSSAFTGYLLILTLICHGSSHAGIEDMPIGARSIAMGATYVALANTADAIFLNPGGLSQLSGTEVSLFFQKPLGLDDVNFGTLTLSLPVSRFRLGVGLITLGNDLYTEQAFSAGFSYHFKRRIYYGLALRYQTARIDGYGSSGALGLDVGFVAPLSSQVTWGFSTTNLNRPQFGQTGQNLARSIKTGVSVAPRPGLLLNLEVFKDVRFDAEIRFGAEFRPFEQLAVRAGTGNNPDRFTTGFGLMINPFIVDYAFFSHSDLGLTHQVSLSIHLGKRERRQRSYEPAQQGERKRTPQIHSEPAGEIAPGQQININTATLEELMSLPGVGPKTAEAIVRYRSENGPFERAEDLTRVRGIGPRTFERLQPFVIVQ